MMKCHLLLATLLVSAPFFCKGEEDGDVVDEVASNVSKMGKGPKSKSFLQVKGRGGEIEVSSADDYSADNTIKVKLSSLNQIETMDKQSGGKAMKIKEKISAAKSKFSSFDKLNFDVTEPENVTYPDTQLTATKFEVSKTLKKRINGTVTDAGTVALIVYLFQEAGNITVGDETTEVNEGTVKFNLKLENFAFCTADEMDCDNKTATGMEVAFKVIGQKGAAPKNAKRKGKMGRFVSLGTKAAMKVSEVVKVDGAEWQNMTDEYPKIMGTGADTTFVVRFPKFTSSALYDPTIDLDVDDVELEEDNDDDDGDDDVGDNESAATILSHFSAFTLLSIVFAKFAF